MASFRGVMFTSLITASALKNIFFMLSCARQDHTSNHSVNSTFLKGAPAHNLHPVALLLIIMIINYFRNIYFIFLNSTGVKLESKMNSLSHRSRLLGKIASMFETVSTLKWRNTLVFKFTSVFI